MSAKLDEITDAALRLSWQDREELIERLTRANEELPPMDPAVRAEALRRLEELKSGKSKPVSHEVVMERLRKKFPQYD